MPIAVVTPAQIDVEPTLNESARSALLKEFAYERRQALKAEQKRKSTQKIAISRSTKTEAPAVIYEATAYVALCDTGCTGITATGVDVRNTIYHAGHRVIAVDPSRIPLGSIIRVNLADGTSFIATAQDTGGHINNYRIDLLVSSVEEAWAFGRQSVGIQILRNGAD